MPHRTTHKACDIEMTTLQHMAEIGHHVRIGQHHVDVGLKAFAVHVFRLAHTACIIQPVVVDRNMQYGHAIGFHPRQCCRYGPAHIGLRHLAGLDLGAGGCMNRLAPRPGQVDVHLVQRCARHPLSLFDGDADSTLCLAHIDHMATTHPARAAMTAADNGHARHTLVDRAALATGHLTDQATDFRGTDIQCGNA
jgi:hypothetical protein